MTACRVTRDPLLYKTSKRDLHYTIVDTSEDKETPGRGGSPAAEGGASASGELGVSVGVGDSRLPPLTEPPAHHTTLGPHGISIPGVTNRAGDRAIFSCGTSCGSGSADQPNYHGDLALAPRPPIDLDYMEQDALLSTCEHAPVVHDRLVTDHHEIHHTIDGGIRQDGDMHSHVIVLDATAETNSHRGDAVCIKSANVPNVPSSSSLREIWEAEINSILCGHLTAPKLRTASDIERLDAEFEACMQASTSSQDADTLAPTTASAATASPAPQQSTPPQQHRTRGARGGQQVQRRMQRRQLTTTPRSPPLAPCASSPLAPCASLNLAPRV